MSECGQLAGNNARRKANGTQKNTGQFQYQNLTKHIAYLLGAYLSDGTVGENKKGWKQFTLEVIDQDFAERVQQAINETTHQKHDAIFIREKPARTYYKAYSGNQELCEWLIAVTHNKQIIPNAVWEAEAEMQREFIAGLLDGDGWFCIGRVAANAELKQYHLGYACTDPWIYDMVAMLHGLEVRTSKVSRRRITGYGVKPLYSFEMNKESFVKAKMYFTIKRKQDRVELWRREVGSSETKRESSQVDEVIVRST